MTYKEIFSAYNHIDNEINLCSEGCLDDDGSCICWIYPCNKINIRKIVEEKLREVEASM